MQRGINAALHFVLLIHEGAGAWVRLDSLRDPHRLLTGFIDARPGSSSDSGQQRCSVGCAFFRLNHLDVMPIHVGLNLTPQWGARSAASESDLCNRHLHLSEDGERIAHAEGNALPVSYT